MHVRYSAHRLEASAATKRLILAAVGHLTRHIPKALLPALARVQPYLPSFRQRILSTGWGRTALESTDDAVPPPDDVKEVNASESEAESTDSSSSSRAIDSDDAGSEPSFPWITPKGNAGYVHAGRVLGHDVVSPVPVCRSTPLQHPLWGLTKKSAMAIAKPWCPVCLSRLPLSSLKPS